ncbi:hypothetical protein GBF38_020830 [Nibea albiflora]|uniref:Uncharacterized protein n=1 Tax=Nibea albiflora TaxID=240163 RepID=A0ACB7FFT5_NIBAL|nr:hypothetical protein GBF38_020830 [Nibea albiflora]
MKTLSFTLAVLLLTVCCCNAMPQALYYSTAPANCCYGFSTKSLLPRRVSKITKSHSSCVNPAFIVKTIKGRQICYAQTFQWALDVYKQQHTAVQQ